MERPEADSMKQRDVLGNNTSVVCQVRGSH